VRRRFALALALALSCCAPVLARADAGAPTFAQLAAEATTALRARFAVPTGGWWLCLGAACGATDQDWGADSLTGVLTLRWRTDHDPSLLAFARALERSAPRYAVCRGARCAGWSDVPLWDAVAALQLHAMTGDRSALATAQAAYASVAGSDVYARGACPALDYQRPFGQGGGLKTLETDANRVLAGVLLAERTGRGAYLLDARRRYATIRQWFFDRAVGLYTVYLFDDGRRCRALPHRFFASVNGVMIEAGRELARATGDPRYAREARATAHAIDRLDDARGIFADLQAENDVVEPLVRALDGLAREGDRWARAWLLRNAAAAAQARTADGVPGRFFDGPAPPGAVTAWQANGALALAIVAGTLAPGARVARDDAWAHAELRPVALRQLPATLRFTGSGIALVGTLGERCCEAGRAAVAIDGRPTTDATGIWQNKSSAGRALPRTILFAWRWPRRGAHVLRFVAGRPNPKEGGGFLDVTKALVIP
jgi:hypothetical protein